MASEDDPRQSPYWNQDLSPTLPEERTWSTWDFAALWISLSACIPTYMMASSLIKVGMSWMQALATILLGNVLVLVPMVLNAHAGAKHGIAFPVYCRAAFGIRGANVPALLRAFVACGWFGIQSWIGGKALFRMVAVFWPKLDGLDPVLLGLSWPQMACFLLFWILNLIVVLLGMDSIRLLMRIKAPLLLALGLLLLAWAYASAGGWGPILSQPSQFSAGEAREGEFWSYFFPALTANVGFWATLALNIPDFSRFARSQKDQLLGQAIGLPTTMTLYSFIGVAVTSATIVIFGEAIWDPVDLLARFDQGAVVVGSAATLCLATLATNIAANVVSPANDFANLAPRWISFRTGGVITAVLGVAILPWKLVEDETGFIFRWLVAYSGLLGAVGGVLIADYFLVRRTELATSALFQAGSRYWFWKGYNPVALVALALGIMPCLPGFLAEIGLSGIPSIWQQLYHYAWFMSFGIAFAAHAMGMKLFQSRATAV